MNIYVHDLVLCQTTIIAGALTPIADNFHLDNVQKGLVVSIISLGSLGGSFIAGYVSDKIGRLKSMVIQNILFFTAAMLLAAAPNVNAIYIGRLFAGFGAAFSIVADVPYLNEICE